MTGPIDAKHGRMTEPPGGWKDKERTLYTKIESIFQIKPGMLPRNVLKAAVAGDLPTIGIHHGFLPNGDRLTERVQNGKRSFLLKPAETPQVSGLTGGVTGEQRKFEKLDEETFRRLWTGSQGHRVRKTRYELPKAHGPQMFLDVFEGKGEENGRMVIDVVFKNTTESENFTIPLWLGNNLTQTVAGKEFGLGDTLPLLITSTRIEDEIVLRERRDEIIHEIGLGELLYDELTSRRNDLRVRSLIGLTREGAPTRADGGILAVKNTDVPTMIIDAIWDQVQLDQEVVVIEPGGTIWNTSYGKKGANGEIILEPVEGREPTWFIKDGKRMPYAQFVDEIASPLAHAIETRRNEKPAYGLEQPVTVAISLGFPHILERRSDGIYAKLIDVSAEGKLPKGWQLTDWNPDTQGDITEDVLNNLTGRGINVGQIITIPDTLLSLDKDAVSVAKAKDLEVIEGGFTAGTGTDGNAGKVKLELTHTNWPTDPVFERMKANGWLDGDEPEPEMETGMYTVLRLAAGLQMLQELDPTFVINNAVINYLSAKNPRDERGDINKLARGVIPVEPEVRDLAEEVLKRTGQVCGLLLAMTAEIARGEVSPNERRALLADGTTLLKYLHVRDSAEAETERLGQPLEIIEANGKKAAAALALSFPYLEIYEDAA